MHSSAAPLPIPTPCHDLRLTCWGWFWGEKKRGEGDKYPGLPGREARRMTCRPSKGYESVVMYSCSSRVSL